MLKYYIQFRLILTVYLCLESTSGQAVLNVGLTDETPPPLYSYDICHPCHISIDSLLSSFTSFNNIINSHEIDETGKQYVALI